MNNKQVAVKLETLIKNSENKVFSERMSSRMVRCASVLPIGEYIGWQMMIPRKGKVEIELYGSESLCESDLEWMAEKVAKTTKKKKTARVNEDLNMLFELYLPVAEYVPTSVGFTASTNKSNENAAKWPMAYSTQFAEIINILRQKGAQFKAVIGPATEEEQTLCRKDTLRSINTGKIDIDAYIGKPVKARFLIRLPSEPTIRLRTVLDEAIPGIMFRYLGNMEDDATAHKWNDPLKDAPILPDYAARVMLMEPDLKESIIGVEVCEESAKNIPVNHKNPKPEGSVVIG